ncbi:MAG: glucosyltransferase domain-containing protein [Lachnospiraceae bacterium]|nr:glucosyltransferase domain-containing protein [Lachnospiraceae bacterium]
MKFNTSQCCKKLRQIQEKTEHKTQEWLQEKDVFITAILVGLLAHGYMLTNKLANIDDYISMFHYGLGYTLGRWLLALMGNFMFRIDGVYSTPFLNGAFFIILLGLSITVFLKPFSFQSRWVKRIFAALFVSFPTVTCTMGFMFTVPFYALAILFMAIAYHVLINYRYGFLFSILLICCSLGIYQAYWGLLASFLLLYLITLCMNDDTDVRSLVIISLKSLCSLLFGVLLYLGVNQIMLKIQNVELASYQGMSQMGQISLSQIPSIISTAYGWFFKLMTENYLDVTSYGIIRAVIAAGYILTVIFFILSFIQNRKYVFKTVAMAVFTLIFPLAVNSIYIMSNDASNVHTMMCYSVVLVFLLPFVFLDQVTGESLKALIAGAARYVYLLALVLVIFFYVRLANLYYLNLELANSEIYTFMETLNTRIQSTEDYSEDKEVLFYGMYDDVVNRNIWEVRMVSNMTGTIDVANAINSPLIRQNIFRIYLGVTLNETDGAAIITEYQEVLDDMPSYPDDGSIVILDDVIVVKLGELSE